MQQIEENKTQSLILTCKDIKWCKCGYCEMTAPNIEIYELIKNANNND